MTLFEYYTSITIMYRTKLLFSRKQCFKMALKIYWSVKTPCYWSTGIEGARSCFYLSRRKRTLFFCKTFVSFRRGILPIILACIVSFAVCVVFSSHPASLFQCCEARKRVLGFLWFKGQWVWVDT